MSEYLTTQARYRPDHIRAVGPRTSGDLSAEFRSTPWRGRMLDQHPGLSFLAGPLTTMPVQSGVGQAYTRQGTGGGRYSGQIPSNPRHGANPHSFFPGYSTLAPMTYNLDTPCLSPTDFHAAQNFYQSTPAWHPQTAQSLGVYTHQRNWPAAMLPQQSPRNYVSNWSSITTTQPLPLANAFPIYSSSACEETGSNEAPFPTGTCPFPKCRKKCRRQQELERHIRERHLPYDIYCGQQSCNWTGNRHYSLQKHLENKHSGVSMPELDASMIYDAKGLVKQLLNKDINVEQAVGAAQSLFKKKAVQLGKLGIRRWMKGRTATRIPTRLLGV